MLLEYAVSNYRSFKDEAYLDLKPAAGKVLKRFPGNYRELPSKERALKSAVIVGENAGGKSNLVESLVFLREMMVRTDVRAASRKDTVNASAQEEWSPLSDSPTTVQKFFVSVALEEGTYEYELELASWGVKGESLSVRKGKGKPDLPVFRARRELVEACDDCGCSEGCEIDREAGQACIVGSFDYGTEGSLERADVERMIEAQDLGGSLALVWLAAVGDEHCKKVLKWVTDDLMVVRMDPVRSFQSVSDLLDLKEVMRDERYLEIVSLLDGSIRALEVDPEQPFSESVVVRADSEGREFRRAAKQDSAGLRAFLVWSYFIFKVVHEGKTVLADEVDGAINPVLSEKVVALINGSDCFGQFVFTTHNIFNLNLRVFMKEQIYFATKDPLTLESTLYSASDFDEIRYDVKQELYEFYLKGMLGGTVHG